MNKDFSKLWEMRRLVQEFEKLDKNISEGSLDSFIEAIKLKEKIQEIIASGLDEGIDAPFAKKLIQIRDNRGYNIDKLIPDETWRDIQKEKAQEQAWEQYVEREDSIDYHYLQRRKEIGTIICNTKLSGNIQRNLENIKDCYANGMYDAAIIYCRALIEYTTYKMRKRKGLIKENLNKNISDIAHGKSRKSLEAALYQIERFINPKVFKHIMDVKELVDEILHSKDPIINYKLTPFDSIRWTFVFVEEVNNVK